MKWIAISGGWRKTNKDVEKHVRGVVRELMLNGNGLVSGGALGVDAIALDEALKHDAEARRIKIFLPASLKFFRPICADGLKKAQLRKNKLMI